jgi:hypothetical protein
MACFQAPSIRIKFQRRKLICASIESLVLFNVHNSVMILSRNHQVGEARCYGRLLGLKPNERVMRGLTSLV